MTSAEKLGRAWGSEPPTTPTPPSSPLSGWEAKVTDAVGDVIAFWGFKHNHGRIWALLYLRDASLTAGELQDELGLSKGAVSMLTRDLEGWGILSRSHDPETGALHYAANTELMGMISEMIRRREAGVIRRAQQMLAAAEAEARQSQPPPSAATLERVRRLRQLADVMDQALGVMLGTGGVGRDLRGVVDTLRSLVHLRRRGGETP